MALFHIICSFWYRFARKNFPRGILKIILLSVIVLSMYIFSTRIIQIKRPSPFNSLRPLFFLLENNGSSHIDDIEELSHLSDKEKSKVMAKMRNSVEGIIKQCTNNTSEKECQRRIEGKTVLTLFTTWIYDKEKFIINNKTLYNWNTLTNVNLVVFSNDTNVNRYSLQAGWNVLPVTQEASRAPILPVMFKETMTKFDSVFYGYANADLLFTGDLIKTLQSIMCDLIIKSEQEQVLIVGKRTNIQASLITNQVATSWTQLKSHGGKHGTLFQSDAEDYFITDKHYPWDSFLPMAVGRRGYDNWVVAYSRLQNITVIDATDTILCLHQTLQSRGNFEGLNKGNYNIDLLKKLDLPFTVGSWGKTVCSTLRTWYDLCQNIVVKKRVKMDAVCSSYYWTYTIYKMLGLAKKINVS